MEPGKVGVRVTSNSGGKEVPKGCRWAWGFQVQLELEAGGCDSGILPELGEEPFRHPGPCS